MTEHEQRRLVNHRLTVLRHAEEVTGNVARTCGASVGADEVRSGMQRIGPIAPDSSRSGPVFDPVNRAGPPAHSSAGTRTGRVDGFC